jgi:hypothetical protein
MATLRQKKVIKELSANVGSTKQALIKAGYSPHTAKTPSRIIKSKSFKELLEQSGVTDEKLTKVLNEGLEATRAVVMGVKSEESFVDIQPDYAIRHKYLETGLKLKGHTKDADTNINLNFNKFMQDHTKRYIVSDNGKS